MLDKVLNAVIQIRKGEDPGPEGKKMVENCELNDEGRIAKLARRYKFDEHQLPWKDLNASVLTRRHCSATIAWENSSKAGSLPPPCPSARR